ncbi:MAG TPA: hypothetical protein VGF69_15695 [Thermoanaerobaculia bacterium]
MAQTIAATPRGIVVAHDQRIELFENTTRRWSVDGVTNATAIITGERKAAVLDALANEARIVDLSSGRTVVRKTGETPIDGLFVGDDLYTLARDARLLECGGCAPSLRTPADPAFLRQSNGRLYVYGRAEGILEEIDPRTLRVTRRVRTEPAASDFEVAGRFAYLVLPRTGKIAILDLQEMQPHGVLEAGAVPVDVAVAKAPNIAVADPSAKRVWVVEGAQSMTQAVTRGFIRGLLGLGLYSNRNSSFPTGVDRVAVSGSRWIAYDSSSATLYRFEGTKSTVLAEGLAATAFTVTSDGVWIWQDGRLRLLR